MNPEGKGLVPGAHRKHYVYRWLRTEELPAGREDLREDWADYIQRRVEKYGEGALDPDVAAAVNIAADAHVSRKLLKRYIARVGPVREREKNGHRRLEIEPILKAYTSFARTELLALRAAQEFAGQAKQEGQTLNLGTYLRQKGAQSQSTKAAKNPSVALPVSC
ncbi:hypothetical protein MYX77_10560 [Acidobacteriia bacterium AH_259_A11_L15]|nr:hypothetical protein [Acidobacteriia bacterium AH_259_A11_L15]